MLPARHVCGQADRNETRMRTSTIGVGLGDAVAVSCDADEGDVVVGVRVYVTLKTAGMTVVNCVGAFPGRVVGTVTVSVAVVSESESDGDDVEAGGGDDCGGPWAEAAATRARTGRNQRIDEKIGNQGNMTVENKLFGVGHKYENGLVSVIFLKS